MRGTLAFDPDRHDYGPATGAVRRLLRDWEAIDWFTPPPHPGAIDEGRRRLLRHQGLARAHRPDLFRADPAVEVVRGGWDELRALIASVQGNTSWDWKFSALKALSRDHARAHGWSLDAQAPGATGLDPGGLFARVGDLVIWNSPAPRVPFEAALPAPDADAARWYHGHAALDLVEAVQWQLAQRSDVAGTNPFTPLAGVYGTSCYPVSLSPDRFALFVFAR